MTESDSRPGHRSGSRIEPTLGPSPSSLERTPLPESPPRRAESPASTIAIEAPRPPPSTEPLPVAPSVARDAEAFEPDEPSYADPPPEPRPRGLLWRIVGRVLGLLDRLPWLLPLGSFLAGVLSFVLVSRGAGMARPIAFVALLSWPWLLVQRALRGALVRRFPSRWTPYALQMITQSLQQEVLFFALPFLFFATQPDWGQWLFTGLAGLAALISVVDPFYEKRIAQRPASNLLFHAYCSFLCTLVVLPLALKVQLENALPLALGLTGVGLLLGLPAAWSDLRNGQARRLGLIGLLLAPAALWLLRAHVPPAGLSVTEAIVTQSVEDRRPGAALRTISASALKARGAVAFVAIRAPMGLEQTVYFQWSQNGHKLDRIAAEITGGGKTGWRTYSRKRNFPEDPRGQWRVDLLTPDGQLIERLRFTVE